MTRNERIERGTRAGVLLDSAEFRSALKDVALEMFDAWCRMPAEQRDQRESLHATYRAIDRITGTLQSYHNDALMESKP